MLIKPWMIDWFLRYVIGHFCCISQTNEYCMQSSVTEDHDPGAEIEDASRLALPRCHSMNQATQTPETAPLAEPHPHPTTTQIPHSCAATVPCRWVDQGESAGCGAAITCRSSPQHFRNAHNIRNLNKCVMICCQWDGCPISWVTRKNFVRHVRERHMDHLREKST